ncbi:MAG: hypothetical protein ACE5LC_06760 [Candidatus Aminicenantales bacterium]
MGSGRVVMPFLLGALVGSGYLVRKFSREFPGWKGKLWSRVKEMCIPGKKMPAEMRKKMMEQFGKSQELAAFATPELREIFDAWVKEKEAAILEFVRREKRVNLLDLAAHFNISLESAVYIISRLALEGKLKLGTVEAMEE